MNSDKFILVLAVIAALVSAISAGMLWGTASNIQRVMLDPGYADVEIIEDLGIQLDVDAIDWGAGVVEAGFSDAYLDTRTEGVTNWDTSVAGGQAPPQGDSGFIVENRGNVALDIRLDSDLAISGTAPCAGTTCWLEEGVSGPASLEYIVRTCSVAIGAEADNCDAIPAYGQAKHTDTDDLSASCTYVAPVASDTPRSVPINPANEHFCENFLSAGDRDELRIDFNLTLPSDILPTGGSPAQNTINVDVIKDDGVGWG